jgi:hypothetical protein
MSVIAFRVVYTPLLEGQEESCDNDDPMLTIGVLASSPEEAIQKVRQDKEQQTIELTDDQVRNMGQEVAFCEKLVIHDVERMIKIDIP